MRKGEQQKTTMVDCAASEVKPEDTPRHNCDKTVQSPALRTCRSATNKVPPNPPSQREPADEHWQPKVSCMQIANDMLPMPTWAQPSRPHLVLAEACCCSPTAPCSLEKKKTKLSPPFHGECGQALLPSQMRCAEAEKEQLNLHCHQPKQKIQSNVPPPPSWMDYERGLAEEITSKQAKRFDQFVQYIYLLSSENKKKVRGPSPLFF